MAIVIACFAVLAAVDLLPFVREKQWKGVAAFLLPFALAVVISLALTANIEFPSALLKLGDLLEAIGLSY